MIRKVITITAEDSPNVRYARAEIAAGREPSGRVLVPGVLTWAEYQQRRRTWDELEQTVGLDARFYEGAAIMLFPKAWLDRASGLAMSGVKMAAWRNTIGCDPAEGGDNTAWAVGNQHGLLALVSKKTSDTAVIVNETLGLMRYWNISPGDVVFDRGGGGKQHADRLRAMGYDCRTVAFGESLVLEPRRGTVLFQERKDNREERYVYKNRRAEMYGELSLLLDPADDRGGYALPRTLLDRKRPDGGPSLREQLGPIPKQYDVEGRLYLPPKNKRSEDTKEKSLVEIIGCSPDEADALVLQVYGMLNPVKRRMAG